MWEAGQETTYSGATLNQKLAKKWDIKFDFQQKKEKKIEEKQGQFVDRLANGEILKEEPRDNNLFVKTQRIIIEAPRKLTNKKFKQQTIQKFQKLEAIHNVKLEKIKTDSRRNTYKR